MKKILLSVSYLAIALNLSACDFNPSLSQLTQEWEALKIVLGGGSSPLAKKPEARPSNQRTLPVSVAAAHAKRNAEMLEEVLSVVYARRPDNKAEFGSLVDTLNQGASLEGLYNGFVHSSDYRQLEIADPGSTPAALKFFATELGYVELELQTPTEFGAGAAQPLGMAEQPTGNTNPTNGDSEVVDFSHTASPSPSTSAVAAAAPAASKPSVTDLEMRYVAQFASASIFTLKRVLGDEIMKLVDEKGFADDHASKALQDWFGPWVVRMASYQVDFGLPQRNKPDAAFHSQWAASADSDLLRWEVLNRIHRVLNAYNRPPATAGAAMNPVSAPVASPSPK